MAVCGAFLVVSLAARCETQAQETLPGGNASTGRTRREGVQEGNSKGPASRETRPRRTQRRGMRSQRLRPVPGQCIRGTTPQHREETLRVRRAHAQRTMEYVSWYRDSVRSRTVRRWPSVLSVARSRNILHHQGFRDHRRRDVRCMRSHMVRHGPNPLGDRLSVRLT